VESASDGITLRRRRRDAHIIKALNEESHCSATQGVRGQPPWTRERRAPAAT